MLFLVRFETAMGYFTTYLIRAKDVIEARNKLEDWLSECYGKRNGDWYMASNGNGVRIETLAKIQSVHDLTEWLPLIE